MDEQIAESFDFTLARRCMVEEQIARRGLREPRLLAALGEMPRHLFVPGEFRYAAYDDCPLPIGFGQTISQPYMVALMTSLLELHSAERVLEVGTGSGYQAAILGRLAGEVHTIEFVPELAVRAERLLRELGFANVHVHTGDGSLGWPQNAPYAGIIVTAAPAQVPRPLLEQLEEDGPLVLPVGGSSYQLLEVWRRRQSKFTRQVIAPVAFVPLRGKHGKKGI
jgi:protein-L-isoaspartate(D-aspartate) O-methyltransferase